MLHAELREIEQGEPLRVGEDVHRDDPPVRDGEIVIPTEQTLERDAVTQPRNDFSTNYATATRQMERQNRRIDREVDKGICSDC